MARYKAGLTGCLLACAGLAALPAAAQVQADVTVSNLRYTVIDLTPDDGQASSFSFTDADPGPLSLSSAVTPRVGADQDAHDGAERRGYFDFSPHTRVSIGLDVHTAMAAAPGAGQTGSVWVGFLATAEWGPPKDRLPRRDSDEAYGDVGYLFDHYTPQFNRDQTLWLTFENDSDYAGSGEFAIQMASSAHADALPAPVPEAPAPLMLAVGVALLGLAGRRAAGAAAGRVTAPV
jgi:hypothetical protein